MKTRAVRMYGKNDLRLEEFELSAIKKDEILAKVYTDSVCMSTYKAAIQGGDHKRVPANIAEQPIIVGHEFAGEIVEVGRKWDKTFLAGQKFSIQPNINYLGKGYAPGYSFTEFGGDATYIIIPNEVMEKGCLLPYDGGAFFKASLAEPMSCIVAGYKAFYHIDNSTFEHKMGIVDNGSLAILAGVGPMGMGAIDYALHSQRRPSRLVVTDIDQSRLDRAAKIFTPEHAKEMGIALLYVNTNEHKNPADYLIELNGGEGYDDVFAFAPVRPVVEMADKILGFDGCLNFFAGPTDKQFVSEINFYNVHYASTHIAGTSGGNTHHMIEALELMGKNAINPAVMVTHIGGLNCAAETTLNLPKIGGGKKLIYTTIDMELTAIDDFAKLGETNEVFEKLAEIVDDNKGLWCDDAEKYLLANSSRI